MGSTNKTSFLGLNQWVLSDKPKMDDYNTDNFKIDNAVKLMDSDINGIESNIGNINSSIASIGNRVTNLENNPNINQKERLINLSETLSGNPEDLYVYFNNLGRRMELRYNTTVNSDVPFNIDISSITKSGIPPDLLAIYLDDNHPSSYDYQDGFVNNLMLFRYTDNSQEKLAVCAKGQQSSNAMHTNPIGMSSIRKSFNSVNIPNPYSFSNMDYLKDNIFIIDCNDESNYYSWAGREIYNTPSYTGSFSSPTLRVVNIEANINKISYDSTNLTINMAIANDTNSYIIGMSGFIVAYYLDEIYT